MPCKSFSPALNHFLWLLSVPSPILSPSVLKCGCQTLKQPLEFNLTSTIHHKSPGCRAKDHISTFRFEGPTQSQHCSACPGFCLCVQEASYCIKMHFVCPSQAVQFVTSGCPGLSFFAISPTIMSSTNVIRSTFIFTSRSLMNSIRENSSNTPL